MGAVQRARRPPGRRPGGADAPYRGLAKFEQEDSRWFFGREDVTDLLAGLADEPSDLPLILVGASGAGKSSLLRAGLAPRLTGPFGLLEPAGAPLAALKAVLADLHDPGDAGRPAIIVDQFETVFTQCRDEAERGEFVSELCELARTSLVILALRADFYDHALRYPGLAAALQARHVVLGPMTAEQVRRAITEPARLARLDVEEGLVGLLLHDLAPPDAPRERRPPMSRARCRCCLMPCSPPGSTAAAGRSPSPTTWPAAGSGTRSPGPPSPRTTALPRRSSGWRDACSCGWCTSPTTRRPPAPRSGSANCRPGATRPGTCSAGSSPNGSSPWTRTPRRSPMTPC